MAAARRSTRTLHPLALRRWPPRQQFEGRRDPATLCSAARSTLPSAAPDLPNAPGSSRPWLLRRPSSWLEALECIPAVARHSRMRTTHLEAGRRPSSSASAASAQTRAPAPARSTSALPCCTRRRIARLSTQSRMKSTGFKFLHRRTARQAGKGDARFGDSSGGQAGRQGSKGAARRTSRYQISIKTAQQPACLWLAAVAAAAEERQQQLPHLLFIVRVGWPRLAILCGHFDRHRVKGLPCGDN